MSVWNGAPQGVPIEDGENSKEKNVQLPEESVAKIQDGGVKKPFEIFSYKENDEGPYRVVVLKIEESDESDVGINKISVGKVLSQNGFMKAVLDIKKVGRNKVIVYLSDLKEANRMCHCQNFALRKLKAYIAKEFVTVKGVIGGIPFDTDDELKEDLVSEKEIVEVFRMFRRDQGKKFPITKVGVVFRSSQLPRIVRLYGVNIRVEPYISKTVMCNKCLRFGHVAKHCKGRPRCINCGESHKGSDECERETNCVHCNGKHRATEVLCPEREKQKNIKRIMANKNFTYQEAKDELRVATKNGFSILADQNEFPTVYESYAKAVTQSKTPIAPSSHNLGKRKQVAPNRKEHIKVDLVNEIAGTSKESGDESIKNKKRRATSQLVVATDEITMEQHLELRKRWEDKLKEMIEQKESYRAVMSTSFQKLTEILSGNETSGAYSMMVELYKAIGQILGMKISEDITGDMTNDEELPNTTE
ncbi:uncharacterized protein LOC129758174 [Uranotaenia lowii]|uniref:uncharacterized protein LOC129758174 n=1 Tax=Uranotaenia lowii TaxID=190385 RepID=UPI0024798894|nr:uncharacterized protein LOC129758174 [Uranotaenia lowii]